MTPPPCTHCLYIGLKSDTNFGGGIVSDTHKQILKTLFGERLHLLEFEIPLSSLRGKLLGLINGYIPGLNKEKEQKVLQAVTRIAPAYVFIDTSTFGRLAKSIKRIAPKTQVITFFHNVEVRFLSERIKQEWKICPLLYPIIRNEYAAVKYSDLLITLNERDRQLLKKYYHRTADHVFPLCLQDTYTPQPVTEANSVAQGLFVGSLFFANYRGIKWFVDKVAPHIKAEITVVGRGFETVVKELSLYDNIHIIGSVTNLADYYHQADFIISPIFDGSGMKTKTAEALMYGKTIFGTAEAFTGYDIDPHKAGALCNTATDFIEAINHVNPTSVRQNLYSRSCFCKAYEYGHLLRLFSNIFKLPKSNEQ